MHIPFKRVSVIGLGYIGMPTAAILASRGIKVIGVDINPKVVETINGGKIHIIEPELDAIVQTVVLSGKLLATTKPETADAFIIAVPTPFKEKHEPDLTYVKTAAQSIAPMLEKGNLVILESTSPVGTTEQLASWLAEKRPDLQFPDQAGESADIQIAYCPERVLPGRILRELVENDRVIGGLTKRCARRAMELYKIFVQGECVITDVRIAEMTKLTENSFRDVNIAFANELSMICEKLDIDVWALIQLANRHPRVKILQPGPGVGGHCIAIDPWFIVSAVPEYAQLIRMAREVNDSKPHYILTKIREKATRFKAPIIACLGLSFKADIDDLRESPSVDIVKELIAGNAGKLLVVEPYIEALPPSLNGNVGVELVDLEDALIQADIIVLLVNHKVFYDVDRKSLEGKVVIDTRGIWK